MAKPRKRPTFNYRRELFSTTFLNRNAGHAFTCGTYALTYRQLSRDLDFHFPITAARLQRTLEAHGIRSLKQLFSIGLHGLSSFEHVGDSLCDLATIILDHAGFDLVAFCGWSEDETPVRFQTLKARQKAQKQRRTLPVDKPHLPSDFHDDGTPREMTH